MSSRTAYRRTAPIVAALLSHSLVGCSPSNKTAEGRTKPKGRILENGLPIKVKTGNLPPGDRDVGDLHQDRLSRCRAGDRGPDHRRAEGSFELIGPDAKGIPPGKYRVAVVLAPYGGRDFFKGKYSREKSKIEVEVKEGEDLVIDVANYK